MQNTIISAEWLLGQNGADIAILDATYFLPIMGRNAISKFEDEHIPTARFFDIDQIKDTESELPHMLPSEMFFQSAMQEMGINSGQQIIVYDDSPFLSSARAWWMLRYFGHENVAVLNGGLKAWKDAGGAIETGIAPSPLAGTFAIQPPRDAGVILFSELRNLIETGVAPQILDARGGDRFHGIAAEPRKGLRSGHIPGSLNLPLSEILDSKTGLLKSTAELAEAFDHSGFLQDRPGITTCGSGVTAAGLTLALAILGKTDIRLYDGSWSEWGASDAPISRKKPESQS